ncbi:hypothetical protein JXB28_00930 [Candidatus Woesearchaeota archaeon]|nr:hypothetical protein [Candidatus Woesearchaeota archaeon]
MRAKITREQLIVALLFLAVLAIRLYLSFSNTGFDYDAYYTLRQAEHIKETGLPLFKDSLSYSGRTFITPPFFYYLLAGFSLFMPLELAAKIMPSLVWAGLVVIIYLIVKLITKNRNAAFISSLFSGLVPILFTTINQASVYSLSLFLIFLLSYAFLRIEEKGFTTMCLALTIILLLTHASVFILLLSFFVYFIILALEKQGISKREIETALFLFFLSLWFYVLLYKKAFFLHGIRFIWQNIPAPLLSSYFQDISFFEVIYAVGIIPLLLGVYAIYIILFKARGRAAMLYISFSLMSFIMLWLKLLPFQIGLLLLSLNLIILSGVAIKTSLVAISKTKVSRLSSIIAAALIILFLITIIPSLLAEPTASIPPERDMGALEWIRNNTSPNSIILGNIDEGFLINYLAGRKNVADSNFLFVNEINQRYSDINRMFDLRLESEALRLLNKYDVDYIFLSTKSMDEYDIDQLFYAEKNCFDLVYDKEAKVYEFLFCDVEQ